MIIVYGINTLEDHPPLALGMCMAYAKQDLPEDTFRIQTKMICSKEQLIDIVNDTNLDADRLVFLFSNYLWSYKGNIMLSMAAKRACPSCITIHGGASTPEYSQVCEAFLRRESHVDFTVAGEGEESGSRFPVPPVARH